MPTPVFVGDSATGKIFKVGRIGLDSGSADPGGNYTATMRTEKHSPAGEDGLCLFRRVYIRILHTGSFTATAKAYVDGVQTKIYSGGVSTGQAVVLVEGVPASSPKETVKEFAINGQGTSIEVELSVASNAITGVFLIESISVGHIPIRQAKERGSQAT